MRWLFLLALAASGCNAIFGLDPTRESEREHDAAAPRDGTGTDASPTAVDAAGPDAACVPFDDLVECTANLCEFGAPVNPPLDEGLPCATGYCDGAGACVACTDDAQCGTPTPGSCTMPACIDHACGTGPSPRDTLCNNQQDQCDGAGNCVDCTTSGGCGECCACFSQVCMPV